ncbi:hypothetical protein MTYM_02319 [Methylococcales bacterium]|nr:hypothetical protein MTYM_02319 [Methylococcales bacterium]
MVEKVVSDRFFDRYVSFHVEVPGDPSAPFDAKAFLNEFAQMSLAGLELGPPNSEGEKSFVIRQETSWWDAIKKKPGISA